MVAVAVMVGLLVFPTVGVTAGPRALVLVAVIPVACVMIALGVFLLLVCTVIMYCIALVLMLINLPEDLTCGGSIPVRMNDYLQNAFPFSIHHVGTFCKFNVISVSLIIMHSR